MRSATFRNYFSSKEEPIVAGLQDRAHEVADNLRRRPADEPIWESLRAVLLPSLEIGMPGHDLMQLLGFIRCHHALLAEHLTSFEELSRRMTEVIAERTGTDVTPRRLPPAARRRLRHRAQDQPEPPGHRHDRAHPGRHLRRGARPAQQVRAAAGPGGSRIRLTAVT